MEIDGNSVAVGVVTELTKDTVRSIFSHFPNKLLSKYKVYFGNFEKYIEKCHSTCCLVRTIINKDKPVNLLDIYVNSKFSCQDEIIDDYELVKRYREKQRIVVSGFGGIGKTIFCKYLWKSMYDQSTDKIPVYFELRNINELTTQDLLSYIRISLTTGKTTIPEDIFIEMMKNGRIAFIFDGFDEVPEKIRPEIQKQILDLSIQYKDCCVIVSSRADDRFSSWLEFHIYHARPFTKSQSRLVIENIEFDKSMKKEFLTEILEKRYSEYSNLFQTPLLTLMMLMTYIQIRYIPDDRQIFYRYAFQTLYTLHDASKQGFQRKRYVELNESEFINIFSLFCLSSYVNMDHSFSKDDIIGYFDKVKNRAVKKYDSEMLLKECVESVNLIYKDGNSYSFIHRSFQEYFCAYAITHYYPDNLAKAIKLIPARRSDSVFSMMHSINHDVVSRMYIIPDYNIHKKIMLEATKSNTPSELFNSLKICLSIYIHFDKNTKISEFRSFSFRIDNDNSVYFFIQSIVCMFDNDLPIEFAENERSFSIIKGAIPHIRKLLSEDCDVDNYHSFRLFFDFGKKVLSVHEGKDFDTYGEIIFTRKIEEV